MKIHFICRGNTFRSRLAEAYFNSLHILGDEASSSGVEASQNLNDSICWYTKKILEKEDLYFLDKGHWTQTTDQELNSADFLIFMDRNCFKICQADLGHTIAEKKYEVWDIKDIDSFLTSEEMKNEMKVRETTSQIYQGIKNHINNLIKR